MYTIIGADGKEYGPVSADKIREWIAGGRVNVATRIRREGAADWTTVGLLPEFAPAPAAAPAPLLAQHAAADPTAAGSLVPAGRGARLGAAFIDTVIGSLAVLPGAGLMISAGALAPHHTGPNPVLAGGALAAMLAGLLVVAGIQVWLLTTRGQTIGKKLLSIRIVRSADHSNPGFVHAVLLRAVVTHLLNAVPLFWIVDVCFIFRDDRRCIHDLIADTVVVQA